jgi:hypothetical protein
MTSITQERRLLADVGRTLRLRHQWGSTYDYTNARTVDEPATRVFVHISVTNPRNYGSNDAHIRAIEAIGKSRFPATGASYNRGHTPDGTAYELQPMGRRGAHTVNDFKRATCTTSGCPGRGHALTAPNRDWNLNYNARAYVIAQNVGDPVDLALVDSVARSIAADMFAGMVDRNAWIHGHRCVSSKSCPADPMWAWMDELEKRVSGYLLSGLKEDDMPTPEEYAAAVWRAQRTDPITGESADMGLIVERIRKHANAAADTDALAAAIVAKLPSGSPTDLATVKQGVREVLLEGVAPPPS